MATGPERAQERAVTDDPHFDVPPPTLEGGAGIEYVDLVLGRYDLLMYWRTLPWDHAPGSLLATEAGLEAIRPDGHPYRPGEDALGLLVGRHATSAVLHLGPR